MKLSDDLKSRMCGGCHTRVVTRAEFLRWVAKAEGLEAGRVDIPEIEAELETAQANLEEVMRRCAELPVLEAEVERLQAAIRPLFAPKRLLDINTDDLIEVEVDRHEWNNLLRALTKPEGE